MPQKPNETKLVLSESERLTKRALPSKFRRVIAASQSAESIGRTRRYIAPLSAIHSDTCRLVLADGRHISILNECQV